MDSNSGRVDKSLVNEIYSFTKQIYIVWYKIFQYSTLLTEDVDDDDDDVTPTISFRYGNIFVVSITH